MEFGFVFWWQCQNIPSYWSSETRICNNLDTTEKTSIVNLWTVPVYWQCLHANISGDCETVRSLPTSFDDLLRLLGVHWNPSSNITFHYCDVIICVVASQITSLTIVYSAVYSDADQRKHQSSMSLAFVRGIHRGPVNSPHKLPVTREMFPFDDVILCTREK